MAEADPSDGRIRTDYADHLLTVVVDREAKLNAVTEAMTQELWCVAQDASKDPDIRAVLITGAGRRSFCAGSDIGGLHDYDDRGAWDFRNRPSYCAAVRAITKPVVAAINGYAFGGGLETALSADIRIASANAEFAAAEVKLGWIGGGGMAPLLAHAIGPSNAALMLLTGERLDAPRARQWGLVSEVHESDDLLPRATELARHIAALPPVATQSAKELLRATYAMPLEQAIQYEADLQAISFFTADASEGRRAFEEKRPPNGFVGK